MILSDFFEHGTRVVDYSQRFAKLIVLERYEDDELTRNGVTDRLRDCDACADLVNSAAL